jgi:hypothetical protein
MVLSVSIKTQPVSQSTGTTNHSVSASTTVQTFVPSNSSPTKVSEVNAVQSTSPSQSGGGKKTKNKSKKNSNQTENTKTQTQPPTAEKKPQRKPKFPCLICVEDHYTRDCPHQKKYQNYLKEIPNPLF